MIECRGNMGDGRTEEGENRSHLSMPPDHLFSCSLRPLILLMHPCRDGWCLISLIQLCRNDWCLISSTYSCQDDLCIVSLILPCRDDWCLVSLIHPCRGVWCLASLKCPCRNEGFLVSLIYPCRDDRVRCRTHALKYVRDDSSHRKTHRILFVHGKRKMGSKITSIMLIHRIPQNCWQIPKAYTRKYPRWDDETLKELIVEGWAQASLRFINEKVAEMPKKLREVRDGKGKTWLRLLGENNFSRPSTTIPGGCSGWSWCLLIKWGWWRKVDKRERERVLFYASTTRVWAYGGHPKRGMSLRLQGVYLAA